MILHYFKLVWAKRKIYTLVMTTLCIAFVLISFFGTMLHREALPLIYPMGMETEENFRVTLSMMNETPSHDDSSQNFIYRVGEIAESIRLHPQIEAVSTSPAMPFRGHYHQTFLGDQEMYISSVDISFEKVFNPKILSGRWFSANDQQASTPSLILSEELAKGLFPRQDPIGQVLELADASFNKKGNTYSSKGVPTVQANGSRDKNETEQLNPYKVIGVVGNLRFQLGGRSRPAALILDPDPIDNNWDNLSRSTIAIRSTHFQDPTELKKTLVPILESQDLSHHQRPILVNDVVPFKKIHEESLSSFLLALIIGGFIALILLSNVAIGIFGVFWQNVLRRFNELGIRRAMGSTAKKVRRLIFGEALALTTLAFIPGVAIYSQFIIFNYAEATWEHGIPAMLFAAGFLILVVMGCALYPSILASTIQPADALREE